MKDLVLVAVFAVYLAVAAGYSNLRRVCYYTNWAQYRHGPGKYMPEDIDPHICSHIIYSFAKLNGNQMVAFEWNDESTEWMKGMYSRFNEIKVKNPSIKTLLAIGGWNMGSAPFTKMVATHASRNEFATTSIKFLRSKGFDGLDLDWEYPANRGSPPDDKYKFTALIKELYRVFQEEAITTGRPRLLLTGAVAAGKDKVDTAYEVPELARYMDFINVMTYDLHGSWEPVTGHNSPLFARSDETGDQAFLNLDWAANYWVQKGVPRDKLNIGLALYGRSFTLTNPSNSAVGAPASKGSAGKYTGEGGFLSYYEICELQQKGGVIKQIPEQRVPYMVHGNQWIGYDDVESLRLKVQYIMQSQFGGVFVWALDLDDFKGSSCNAGRYPLMKAINSELGNVGGTIEMPRLQPTKPKTVQKINYPVQPPAPQKAPVVAKKVAANTFNQKKDTGFHCTANSNGFFRDPKSCSRYFICTDGVGMKFECAPGLMFDQEKKYCNWPAKVNCKAGNTNQQTVAQKITPTVKQPPAVPIQIKSKPSNDVNQQWSNQQSVQPRPTQINQQQNVPAQTNQQIQQWGQSPNPSIRTPVQRQQGIHKLPPQTQFRQQTRPVQLISQASHWPTAPVPTPPQILQQRVSEAPVWQQSAQGWQGPQWNVAPTSAQWQPATQPPWRNMNPTTQWQQPQNQQSVQQVNPTQQATSNNFQQQNVVSQALGALVNQLSPGTNWDKEAFIERITPIFWNLFSSSTNGNTNQQSLIQTNPLQTLSNQLAAVQNNAQQQTQTRNQFGSLKTKTKRLFCASRADGSYVDPTNCAGFIKCAHKETYTLTCPGKLVFNPQTRVCDYAKTVPGCRKAI